MLRVRISNSALVYYSHRVVLVLEIANWSMFEAADVPSLIHASLFFKFFAITF